MADVTDRGQLILVMGLLLAVSFVVLALLLNTVIYTENLASRGTDLGGRDAVEFDRTLVTGIGELVDEENEEEYDTNASVRSAVSDGVEEATKIQRLRHAERAVIADATLATMHNGAVIRQTDSTRTLNSSGNTADWVLAEDLTDTRRFAVDIAGGLNATSDPDAGFIVVVREAGGGADWQVSVYNDSGTTTIAVMNGSESSWTTGVCSPSSAPRIDLTAGTVDGEACPALVFGKEVSPPYDIRFVNGDEAQGTYNLTVNVSGAGSVSQSNLNDPSTATSPYFVRAVYSLTLDIHYETADVRYVTERRIARGEPA